MTEKKVQDKVRSQTPEYNIHDSSTIPQLGLDDPPVHYKGV